MSYFARFLGSERVRYVTIFIILNSLLGGDSSDAKIYIGCVSKMGETRVSCSLGGVWKSKERKGNKKIERGAWAFLAGGLISWIRPKADKKEINKGCIGSSWV